MKYVLVSHHVDAASAWGWKNYEAPASVPSFGLNSQNSDNSFYSKV
jgi:hypothetical protein